MAHEQIDADPLLVRKSSADDAPALFPAQHALGTRLWKPAPGRVYHYASKETGLAILRSSSVWASHIRHLSGDPDEYTGGLALVAARIIETMDAETDPYVLDLIGRWGAQWKRIIGHDRLVACFSESRDLASQWERYGRGGYAFGFDAHTLGKAGGASGYMLTNCIYDDHETVCNALIDDALHVYHHCREAGDDHDAAAMKTKVLFEIPISTVMPRLKKERFRPESEFRLLSAFPLQIAPARSLLHRPGENGPIPYEPVAFREPDGTSALREIMIAPGVDFEVARAELQPVLAEFGHEDADVIPSALGSLRDRL